MSTVVTNIRIDKELKAQATELFNDLGLTLSQAFTVFLKQAILHHGLPFAVTRPPSEQVKVFPSCCQNSSKPSRKAKNSPTILMQKLMLHRRSYGTNLAYDKSI